MMASFDVEKAKAAVEENWDQFVAELQELCTFRSRRSEPEEMERTAAFIAGSVQRWGGSARVIPWEDSYPYVLGEFGDQERTLVHFTHYDVEVEPAGDDAEWISPPFAAEIRDGRLYARGVADDKGVIMSRIHACAAWALSGQSVPIRNALIFEGKKTLHSPGLPSFVAAHADELRGEAALWENSWVDSEGRPLLKLSEKGIVYVRLTVKTLSRDLTSQNTVLLPSATARLAHLLASLQDEDGRVRIPGFYDAVRALSDREDALIDALPFAGDFLRERAGVSEFIGGPTDQEAARLIRMVPTVTVTGVYGGDLNDDVTLGIPAEAWAKIEIRLVPDQDPQKFLAALRAHLDAGGYADVQMDVMAANAPNATSPDDPFVTLVADAARDVYGTEPVIEPFTQWVGNQSVMSHLPIVGIGVSRDDSGVDGPNEQIRLDDYKAGILHVIEVMARMAADDA